MLVGGGILALPVGLILMEPDAGQAITYLPLLAVVLFLSSIRMWLVVAAMMLALVAVPGAYVVGVKTGAIKGYQQERINVILDPENADRRGFGYHTWQSMLTVGKGQLTGARSAEDYSQSRLKFLPEPHTDFIFAVTAETTGFVGSLLLLLAYAVLLSKLIHGARRAPDRMGMLVIMSITGGFAFQILHQRRHGARHPARHRRAAAADERGTLQRARHLCRHRLRHQRPSPPLRQLSARVKIKPRRFPASRTARET